MTRKQPSGRSDQGDGGALGGDGAAVDRRIADHAVVVGVDGSVPGDAALVWALREADLRQCAVVAVHAWTMPYVSDISGYAVAAMDPSDLAAGATAVLEDALAAARERAPEAAGVPVHALVIDGAAAPELVALSEHADLVVVGSRGHGGFTGLLLGSVSQQVAHHARCPVVIVHPAEQATSGHGRHHGRGAAAT